MRPTLLNSCARAATAAEARFRIDYLEPGRRASRVIALDEVAAEIVRDLAGRQWQGGGHFLALDQPAGTQPGPALRDAALGTGASLSAELDGADVAVLIATAAATPASALAASAIGNECAFRGIMSAGLVLCGAAGSDSVRDVVTALRPNAMVLVVLCESDDIAEILTALRV